MSNASFTFISGPQGAGKTTVLRLVPKFFSDPESIKIIQISSELKRLSRCEGKELRAPSETSKEEVVHLTDRLVEELEGVRAKLVFLDGHNTRITDKGSIERITSDSYLRVVGLYIVIRADCEIILQRRTLEIDSRKRKLDLDLIRKEQEGEIRVTKQIASKASIPVVVVDNNFSPEIAAQNISTIIKEQFGI